MIRLSEEAEKTLKEIIDHDSDPNYWEKRFSDLDKKNKAILEGSFKELSNNQMVKALWGDNIPYYIQILRDGYLYFKNKKNDERATMSRYELKLDDLINEAEKIIDHLNRPEETVINSDDWLNDAEIFYNKYLKDHPLGERISTILFHRNKRAFDEMLSCLKSIQKDEDYTNKMNGIESVTVPSYQAKNIPMYDVFISHANSDKTEIVEDLVKSLNLLKINVFYDKESLEWGDKWKEKILEGTKKSEFAIIVISENFFGREWTEKELNEFLNRQNRNGQKLILPIIHNITMNDLANRYPSIADIQVIDSSKYTSDQIALLFARQLIKRLKSN